jgi:hypothetical protein
MKIAKKKILMIFYPEFLCSFVSTVLVKVISAEDDEKSTNKRTRKREI